MKSKSISTVEYYALKVLISIFTILPRFLIYAKMRIVALIFYHASSHRRKITSSNLAHAFPDLSQDEIKRLTKEVYVELSITISDMILMLVGRLEVDDMIVNYNDAQEKLDRLKLDHSRGIIFMGAHFSNWELPPLFASKHGFPMTVIGRKGDNILIDKEIVLPFRERYGNQTAYKKKAGISMMRTLKKGGTVGLLIDQKVNKENGFLVPFFGREAFTTHALAVMKLKSNPAIIPISVPRVSKGKYRLEIGETIEYVADEVLDENAKLLSMTKRYNQALEETIRAYPAQWFWMHDRWNKRV